MSTALPKIALATLFLVVVFGYGWIHRHDGNTETPAQTVKNVKQATATTYTVPACGRNWPPTCPGNSPRRTPDCARHWPSTCVRSVPDSRYVVSPRDSVVSTPR